MDWAFVALTIVAAVMCWAVTGSLEDDPVRLTGGRSWRRGSPPPAKTLLVCEDLRYAYLERFTALTASRSTSAGASGWRCSAPTGAASRRC